MKKFMIAGVSSNVGKTTVTMGVMRALVQSGYSVVPFKTGPDYIDPMFHTFVTDVPSTNLDTWLLDDEITKRLFYEKLQEDSVAVVEGVMGLYDGHSREDDTGSSAYLSELLDCPVFLVIDGRGMAKSAAAMVKGYAEFKPGINLAGVIINKINTPSHYDLLKEMIETYAGVPCVGYFPETKDITMNSRHLGLIPVDELVGLKQQVDRAAEVAKTHVDLEQMLRLAEFNDKPALVEDPFATYANRYQGKTIAYAKDKAFNFYYQDNLKALKGLGFKLKPFSPLTDSQLPEPIDALYLGGGFPEVFAEELEANEAMRTTIKTALESGLPCYAECGGFIYLTRQVTNLQDESRQLVGFYDMDCKMTKGLQRFGYAKVTATFGSEQLSINAHEFHHSCMARGTEKYPSFYTVTKGDKSWIDGFRHHNTLAGYPHLHFYANPLWLIALLDGVFAN